MIEKLPYWAAVVFGAFALVLLVVNFSLASSNRAAQMDVAQRQNTIASGQALSQVNQGLVQAMAEASIKNNNMALRDLLVAQGITLRSEAANTKSEQPAAKSEQPAVKATEKK